MGNTISYNEVDYVLDLGERGKVKGIQYDDKARRYAGIPYGLPPTGEHRWRKPRPLPDGWTLSDEDGCPLDARKFRPPAPQASFSSGAEKDQVDDEEYSEDCLVLNIWTPVERNEESSSRSKWPVYVWLHGGWFQMGTPSQEPSMSPVEKISTGKLNAVVVAVGYRLNVFGFLASEELRQESHGESAGNFGLWDQRLALEWVKANIHLFGGDAGNITLAGRSAGSYGVHAQLMYDFRRQCPSGAAAAASPPRDRREQLFHRVFMCSNAIPAQPRPLAEAQPQFDELCAHFGIPASAPASDKLSRLRRLPHADLVQALGHLTRHTFRPVTDDLFVLPGMMEYQRSQAFADEFARRGLRLLIGEVRNEETLYATYNAPGRGLESLRIEVANYYGDSAARRILENYALPGPDADDQAWRDLFGRIISDGQVRAPSRALVSSLASRGVPLDRLWRYQIAYRLSFITDKVAPINFGVAHAMDKPFWNYSIMLGPTPKERVLMDEWIKILVAFVQDDEAYDFGTTSVAEWKVATPQATVEIQRDAGWEDLTRLGDVFAGYA
ncbi:hypothetical protein VTK73DRAFT_7459 [Phialemonium thermophilum]|uniref:Carboxylic ester hydrolase n=1 Tax=Phialemonium thermophilum TaxID=223376 RepID=A0ABR3WEH9_9PEZI